MTSMTIEQAVRQTAGRYADSHPSIVSGVVANYNEGGPEQAKRFLINAGHGGFASYVDEVSRLVNDPSVAEAPTESAALPIEPFEPFDKAQACEVIRAFLIDIEEYEQDEVTALLVLAGLEDEVVPEPEPEPFGHEPQPGADETGFGGDAPEPADDTASVLARIEATLSGLVGFARGHGYSG